MAKLVAVATLALAIGSTSCGDQVSVAGSSFANGGVIAVPQSATYSYVLQSGCVGSYQFRLEDATGNDVWFPRADTAESSQKGTIGLTTGNWTGQWFFRPSDGRPDVEEQCTWALTLSA